MTTIPHPAKPRVFAISDIHVDFQSNMDWLTSLDPSDYQSDVLIVAGDLTDDLDRLTKALSELRARFARVFFVPGNHELWIRKGDFHDSLQKFYAVLKICDDICVDTKPALIDPSPNEEGVWIVPLYSWYVKPEQGISSLFVDKVGEDPTLSMWANDYFTRWPRELKQKDIQTYFLELNTPYIETLSNKEVITFSHFLPRSDLIFATDEEVEADANIIIDDVPEFNFSRVAGDARLDEQIRAFGARVHVYGHQHRNRRRMIDNVLYVSNCVGYLNSSSTHHRPPAVELAHIW